MEIRWDSNTLGMVESGLLLPSIQCRMGCLQRKSNQSWFRGRQTHLALLL
jgi:hypothetical protein